MSDPVTADTWNLPFNLGKPEATTIIRWCLRVILVVFLAWLIRRRPEQAESDDEPEIDEDATSDVKRGTAARSRPANARSNARLQQQQPLPRRDQMPYQRRRTGDGDFNAVIDKVSKPKDMWEVRRGSGESHSQSQSAPRRSREMQAETNTGGVSSSLASLMASMGSTPSGGTPSTGVTTPTERPKVVVNPPERKKLNVNHHEADPHEKMLHGHQRPVTFITWNPEGNLLYTCSKDSVVCLWSTPDGECLGTFAGHHGAVSSCSVSPNSRWLVTAGSDQLIIVWEAQTPKELTRIELKGSVRSVEWAPGDRGDTARFVACHNRFASHAAAVVVFRFDGQAIDELVRITTLPAPATQVSWGSRDETVASAHESGQLLFWNATTGARERDLKAHDNGFSKFEFSTDRELVATVSHDCCVKLWDLGEGDNGTLLFESKTDRPLNDVALGSALQRATTTTGKRPSSCCLICAGGQDVRQVTTSASTTEQFNTLLFKLPSESASPAEFQAVGVTKGHFGPVHSLTFSPSGKAIASGSEDGCV
eukprot:CAMPEP_0206429834 /NCGR_PEP_ID=MMETSP0324_2-20121206/6461_1 /ASSEMBLY_ACC=CAM_ASM_000836 /TAXON_ID=2866 /ORGANISM="Crypthecodinium cohnii, Strain Seligo" /LENGTH=536 /DNA_ID=CAMNT_0053895559 /DNA_START=60 /DNA_END=1666 /DNA_ORIENTATION=-